MKLGALIFSRFDSSRLPGKALLDIHTRTLLGRVLDLTKRVSNIDEIIIATTDREVDNVIEKFSDIEKVKIFRGNFKNVALRAIDACECFGLDGFVRICGDRPFFDSDLVSQLAMMFKQNDYDLVVTPHKKNIPAGLTAEVISIDVLRDNIKYFMPPHEEHLTSYFYENADSFNIKSIVPPKYITKDLNIRLVVDNKRDLERARWIALNLNSNSVELCMSKIISLASTWETENPTGFT